MCMHTAWERCVAELTASLLPCCAVWHRVAALPVPRGGRRMATTAAAAAAPSELVITRPDDWHLHVRDGAGLKSVVPHTARHYGRAIIMPNLVPPVTTAAQVQRAAGNLVPLHRPLLQIPGGFAEVAAAPPVAASCPPATLPWEGHTLPPTPLCPPLPSPPSPYFVAPLLLPWPLPLLAPTH